MDQSKHLSKILVVFFSAVLILAYANQVYGQQDVDYEKWSKVAISSVQKEYPQAELTDLKFAGQEKVNENQSKDTFEIKVKQNGESFTARVEVFFNPKTEELLNVKINRLPE
ncbi:DUF3889 domain-containing protein [Metabacillus arenae]|uniref:DUF3889 domain-containing protein n=1 Tax=Metabacillus arenae TaxID=2771434 RepID=A0A926NQP3_9BACI|nr:DUF3889 domain-containing protein [Metabacillus arenae]MBD1382257.1 DUF3889 domain-containing protein [Metabacillus arenae]